MRLDWTTLPENLQETIRLTVQNEYEKSLPQPETMPCSQCCSAIPFEPPTLPLERIMADQVNRYCLENESNTPDFILGEFLASCLVAFNVAVRARDKWYGIAPEPGGKR